MDKIEKKISSLVEQQFPAFYRTDGPIFVAFVKEYYKWMESNQRIACPIYLQKHKGTVKVISGNNQVIGYNSRFLEDFYEGGQIAIYKNAERTDYEIFTIDSIANSEFLTLKTAPSFSSSNTRYCLVRDQLNPLYYTRRIYDYRDIDNTVDEFIIHFKETYLKNIQFDTNTNIRQLVKHALDIYRSKGTERSIDLLFKIVFGVPAKVYYPGDDLFRLSDGHWYRPQYLEISLHKDADKFVNKQITGLTSGATAFVEAAVRRTVKGRLLDILYISAINGNFVTGEKINADGTGIRVSDAPTIIGSLTSLKVDEFGTGQEFKIGDIVKLESQYGTQGRARVTSISDITGLVNFELLHGGYGYTANAEVLISNTILTISDLVIDANNESGEYFTLVEQLIQPMAVVEVANVVGSFTTNMEVYAYTNNVVTGTGRVLLASNTGLTIAILSGDMDEPEIYNAGNTVSATVIDYTDATATANVVGWHSNVRFTTINKVGNFQDGEEIYQLNGSGVEVANAVLLSYSTSIGANGSMRVANNTGAFKPGAIYGRTSNATANISAIHLQVGVNNLSGNFVITDNNFVYGASSNTVGTVTIVSEGSGATVDVSDNLLYTENVELSIDYLRDYVNVALDATSYGFPGMPSANLTNGTLDDILSTEEYTIGKLSALIGVNQGEGYNSPPIVRIYEPITFPYRKHDIILEIEGIDGNFAIGELVTQLSTDARGIVKSSNSSVVFIEQLRFSDENNFIPTTNATTIITGESSSTTANVVAVVEDGKSGVLGYNAEISAETQTANGAVTGLEVIDSGFGYLDGEEVVFSVEDKFTGTATAVLGKHGKARGYYKQMGGFLSNQKKLHDGHYYQEYSYEVRSSIALNKYADMLRKLLHVAGTKSFAAYVLTSEANTNVNILNAKITQA